MAFSSNGVVTILSGAPTKELRLRSLSTEYTSAGHAGKTIISFHYSSPHFSRNASVARTESPLTVFRTGPPYGYYSVGSKGISILLSATPCLIRGTHGCRAHAGHACMHSIFKCTTLHHPCANPHCHFASRPTTQSLP